MGTPPAATNHVLFKSRQVLYQEASEGRQFDAVYFAMMIFGCLVALMGLLLNSPAVIIGAMLISPLMGPILACGLALTTAEWSLGKKAARNLALSVFEIVLIALLATHLSPLREVTPEILARTNPNLMDLLVAFFSGLAGTVALASRKTGFTILPGVAIATAVMPPLAVVGYGLGTGQWSIASGAFMLFFTNFTAIVLSASLVFLLLGFRPQQAHLAETHHLLVRWRIVIAAAVLLIISIPLVRTLLRASQQARIRTVAQDTLRRTLQAHGERHLDSLKVVLGGSNVSIVASVRTADYIEPGEVEQFQAAIQARVSRPILLRVQQLQLARKTASTEQVIRDFLAAGLVRPAAEQPRSPALDIEDLQQRIEGPLRSLVEAAGVTAQITSVGKAADGTVVINVLARAPQLTSMDMWKVAASGLASQITSPVRINVVVAVTGAALEVRYRSQRVTPTATELRRLRLFSTALPKDVAVALRSSAEVDQALAPRRLEQLRKLVLRDAVEAEFDPPATTNVVAIVPVQTFRADSLGAVPAKPQ